MQHSTKCTMCGIYEEAQDRYFNNMVIEERSSKLVYYHSNSPSFIFGLGVYNQEEMRKEVLLAIIVGIILGTIILFGIKLANQSSTAINSGTPNTTSPTPTTTAVQKLSITTPLNHSVTTEKVITLSGKADPGSTLAIISESDDLIINASPEGTFSAQINLISGENIITVSQVLKNQTIISEIISIIQTGNLPE